MLNSKSYSIIDKNDIKGNIHIVGAGATGSQIVVNLVRLNLADKIICYDFDTVEEKNLNNQAFFREHIGMKKVDAIKHIASMIDDEVVIRTKDKAVDFLRTKTDDIVILAVDNFEVRGSILSQIEGEPLILSGGINSNGGNVEVTRGLKNTQELAEEYQSILGEEIEEDEDELSPCGSPISIYHRVLEYSAILTEQIIRHYKEKEVSINYTFSSTDYIYFKKQ